MNCRVDMFRQFSPMTSSAVATTTDDEEDTPAATGKFPVNSMSIPHKGMSIAIWKRSTAALI